MQRIRSFCMVLSLVLAAVASDPYPASAQKHAFTNQCDGCHLTDPAEGVMVFNADIDILCRNCHDLPKINSHPSDIASEMAVPPGFWLDDSGRLNCATCHDPHPGLGEDAPFMLRGTARDIEFCRLCHPVSASDEGMPLAAVFVAHGRSYTLPVSGSELDKISADCLSCHEGSGGPHVDYCLLLENMERNCTGHIIGADYAERAARNRGLRSLEGLSGNISLYEGKVGCASCHSIYSTEERKLVMNNSGSALCKECHIL